MHNNCFRKNQISAGISGLLQPPSVIKAQLTLILLLVLGVSLGFSQTSEKSLDSLKAGLANSHDSLKSGFYTGLISSYAYTDRDSATFYAERFYEFETDRKDDEGISTALYLMGNLHYDKGDYDTALSINREALS